MADGMLMRLNESGAALYGGGIAPIHVVHGPRGAAYRISDQPVGGVGKRALDIFIAGSALAILALPLLLIGLLIRLESRGPAIFSQWRAGYRGRAFRIYKLRTMSTRDDGRRIKQATRNDSRVTGLGRFLRRTSIDELPQLINVLKGDMSIVGPRPHAVAHEHEFKRAEMEYAMRRMARPGLTGLAQVSGARGLTDTPEKLARRIELDLAYIERWSLPLDLAIIVRTAGVLVGDRSAF